MIKPRVLFVCTENACRSQMAEGFLRHHAGDRFEAFSGGAEVGKLNPTAVEVMKEAGIDIAGHRSEDVAEFLGQSFHFIIRVCEKVKETCPVLPGAIWYLDWSLEDPVSAKGSPTERTRVFRHVRDEIEAHVLDFIAKES
jgi:arsenate reductase (thioredoxin)